MEGFPVRGQDADGSGQCAEGDQDGLEVATSRQGLDCMVRAFVLPDEFVWKKGAGGSGVLPGFAGEFREQDVQGYGRLQARRHAGHRLSGDYTRPLGPSGL